MSKPDTSKGGGKDTSKGGGTKSTEVTKKGGDLRRTAGDGF